MVEGLMTALGMALDGASALQGRGVRRLLAGLAITALAANAAVLVSGWQPLIEERSAPVPSCRYWTGMRIDVVAIADPATCPTHRTR